MDVYTSTLILFAILFILCLCLFWNKVSSYFDIIIIILLILAVGYYLFSEGTNHDVVYVKSDIDGELYLVRDLPDKQYSANALSKIKKNMLTLNSYLVEHKNEFPNYVKCIDLLNSRIKNSVLIENGEDNVYTSYSVNKGEQLVFCLRSKRVANKLHDMNLMMYVVLHEMAHVGCTSIGHTDEFKRIFAFYTQQAIKIGLYEKIDFPNDPREYCGMTITESII